MVGKGCPDAARRPKAQLNESFLAAILSRWSEGSTALARQHQRSGLDCITRQLRSIVPSNPGSFISVSRIIIIMGNSDEARMSLVIRSLSPCHRSLVRHALVIPLSRSRNPDPRACLSKWLFGVSYLRSSPALWRRSHALGDRCSAVHL